MIHGTYWQLHDDATIRRLDAAAVRLLTKGGCRVEHEELLGLLEAAGCRVEHSSLRCFFTEKLIREAIEHLGAGPNMEVEVPAGWNPQQRLRHGGSYPHLLEWPDCKRRLATRQDVVDMAKMAHVMDEFQHVGKVLTCSEVDQRIEPLWAALQLAQITDKPIGGGEIFYADYIEPLMRMGEVLSGETGDMRLVAGCDFFIAPLIFDRRQAECFLAKRRLGQANWPGTMPISGISAPVTIAGTVAIALAELTAGWVMGYVVNPDLPAGGIVSSGSLDMRTMTARFGSPEALLQDATVVNISRRLYGIGTGAATGYVDCKRPGLEAAFQKMLPLATAPFGTRWGPGGGGLLSAGQCYSCVQHLLDAEIATAVGRFTGHYEVTEETLALELIEEMLGKPKTNFMDTEHTATHYRAEQWYPRWFDRTGWQGDAAEAGAEHRILERIDAHCRDAIARYDPPEIDPGKIAELRRIFLAAERDIIGKNATDI